MYLWNGICRYHKDGLVPVRLVKDVNILLPITILRQSTQEIANRPRLNKLVKIFTKYHHQGLVKKNATLVKDILLPQIQLLTINCQVSSSTYPMGDHPAILWLYSIVPRTTTSCSIIYLYGDSPSWEYITTTHISLTSAKHRWCYGSTASQKLPSWMDESFGIQLCKDDFLYAIGRFL